MENSYGIGVSNRFALFIDEEQDPLEILKDQEQAGDKKKADKGAEKENKSKSANKNKVVSSKKVVAKDAQQNNSVAKAQESQPLKKDGELSRKKRRIFSRCLITISMNNNIHL